MILNTEKTGCRQVAAALAAYGIRHIVTSPGSRNAPLIMAFNRYGSFRLWPVIDERSAAFVALGIARTQREPVAVVCTSGTALLNYGPAVAEAYYSRIPLVVISADRPEMWIDQADSQTIHQTGALSNIVAAQCTVAAEPANKAAERVNERRLNEALTAMTTGAPAPVHINVPIAAPISRAVMCEEQPFSRLHTFSPTDELPTAMARDIAAELISRRVMVVAGDSLPDYRVDRALQTMASLPNCVVVADPSSNLHFDKAFCPDALLAMPGLPKPEVIISCGGAVVSARLKDFLRESEADHWVVGHIRPAAPDTYLSLTRHYDMAPGRFFSRLAGALLYRHKHASCASNFADLWASARNKAQSIVSQIVSSEFSAISAVCQIIESIPKRWNLELSNGMTVRHASMAPWWRLHRIGCNRGTSGIEGSTSTALGASLVYDTPTLLITGDMSAQYDIAALASNLVTPKLKIAVVSNRCGGIFDVVATTRDLPESEQYIKGGVNLPTFELAKAYGLRYIPANSPASLHKGIKEMIQENEQPVILEIFTDSLADATALKHIIETAKNSPI